jgi:hypothetical protein
VSFFTARVAKRDIFSFLQIDGATTGNVSGGWTKRQG